MERKILHADLNNFYASVECLLHPEYRNVPLAVTGDPEKRHGIVLSKNEAAKALGVKTGEVIWKARQKCGELLCIAPHFDEYMHFSRQMREIYRRYSPRVEPFGLDEAWVDMTESGLTLQEAADLFRALAKEELGLTISVGASFNKVFAKLGSDMKKPDGTTVITRENYREKVWPLPVEELLYVGPATKQKLNRVGIMTIGALANADPRALRSMLGKWGDTLGAYARGEDAAPVARTDEASLVKSVGNSATTPRDLCTEEDVKCLVYLLSESVASRLREQGLEAAVVSISVRDDRLYTYTRQSKLKTPTCLSGVIAQTAMELFLKSYLWNRPVRSLGVACSQLSSAGAERQLSCFDQEERTQEARKNLENTIDGLRRRFGNRVVVRAMMVKSDVAQGDPKRDHVIYPAGFQEKPEFW